MIRSFKPVSGIADSQSDPKSGEPRLIQSIVADKVAALTVAQIITAALYAKARGAGGQFIEFSMLAAAIAFQWPDTMYNYMFMDDGVTHMPTSRILRHHEDARRLRHRDCHQRRRVRGFRAPSASRSWPRMRVSPMSSCACKTRRR